MTFVANLVPASSIAILQAGWKSIAAFFKAHPEHFAFTAKRGGSSRIHALGTPDNEPASLQNASIFVVKGMEADSPVVVGERALTALVDAVGFFVKNAAASYQLVQSPTSSPTASPTAVTHPSASTCAPDGPYNSATVGADAIAGDAGADGTSRTGGVPEPVVTASTVPTAGLGTEALLAVFTHMQGLLQEVLFCTSASPLH